MTTSYIVANWWDNDFSGDACRVAGTPYLSYSYIEGHKDLGLETTCMFEAMSNLDNWLRYPFLQFANQARTPRGYGGPVASSRISQSQLQNFWRTWEFERELRGIEKEFVRFMPWANNHLIANPDMRVWRAGDVYVIYPSSYQLTSRAKGVIHKATKSGAYTDPPTASEEALDNFLELYYNAITEWGIVQPPSRLALLHLGAKVILGRDRSGQVQAGAVFLEGEEGLHYHLAASGDRGKVSGVPSLIIDRAVEYARMQGHGRVFLGGGRGGQDDSLALFKKSFTKHTLPFYVGEWVGKSQGQATVEVTQPLLNDSDPISYLPKRDLQLEPYTARAA